MYTVSFMAMAIPGLTVAAGFYIYLKKDKANVKRIRKLVRASVLIYVMLVAVFLFFLMPGIASAASSADPSSGMGFLAAALSTGLSAIAAGYAVAVVGSSAIGAISEDPNIVGKTIIFVGLAEGIAIYGLIVSIMILAKL